MEATKLVKVSLPSGNLAVYEVEERHANPEDCRRYGVQQAVCFKGEWYTRGLKARIRHRLLIEEYERITEVSTWN